MVCVQVLVVTLGLDANAVCEKAGFAINPASRLLGCRLYNGEKPLFARAR